MAKRFVTIGFRYLRTDWFARRHPHLRKQPFVLATPDHGRMIITAANPIALHAGILTGTALADARAIIPSLAVLDDDHKLSEKILTALAGWFIRFTPIVAVDLPDGLILDVTGCTHLWGGEQKYLDVIIKRMEGYGYHVRIAMADTIGAAWAFTNYGEGISIIGKGEQAAALLSLPAAALRLEALTLDRLQKLGLRQVGHFMGMPRNVLRRRFGNGLITRLDQALGKEEEIIQPVQPVELYEERLPCLEPVVTITGIEIALQRLLQTLCFRLRQQEKGLRQAGFSCYRVDGGVEKIGIGTNRPTNNTVHLFKLFEPKLSGIEPALGIELFTLHIAVAEDLSPLQEKLWQGTAGLEAIHISELMDRLANRIGADRIHRYLPAEHHWPERSVKQASSFHEKTNTAWRTHKQRPVQLLARPEPVEVTSPIPDYPPMLFRYKNKLHKIIKADGPERIEPEWWLDEKPHRDYYCVEDEEGHRYWLFRSGHYKEGRPHQWFIHGFFA